MKTKLLIVLFAVITSMGFTLLIPNTDALCMENKDWPEKPCFDEEPVDRSEFKAKWAPYYDFKGADFMESKKIEMFAAIEDGTFYDWESNQENSNAYAYYVSTGEVEKQFSFPIFQDEPIDIRHTIDYDSTSIVTQIAIITSIPAAATIIAFVITRKKRK